MAVRYVTVEIHSDLDDKELETEVEEYLSDSPYILQHEVVRLGTWEEVTRASK